MDSRAARSAQSRVAGNRDLSGLCIGVRNGDGHSRAVACAIHMVPSIWGASGGLVGSPALALRSGEFACRPVKAPARLCLHILPRRQERSSPSGRAPLRTPRLALLDPELISREGV